MEIIAKTDAGFLISGTKSEVEEILRSVNGKVPEEIEIGQKIPAIDYSATITKLKQLPEEYAYGQLIRYAKSFTETIDELKKVVESATKI